MQIIDMLQGSDKILTLSKWVKGNLTERCIMVARQPDKNKFIELGVPRQNIILASNYKQMKVLYVSKFKEMAINEADKTLELLLGIKIATITGENK